MKMTSQAEANKATGALNGTQLARRTIIVMIRKILY
ncbi:MAG: hypothetical protein IH857_03650 [Deltaproteobacteria bacterium]|nr:hypothetical protein [Deltaproteobacteria bacterium]